MRLAARAPTAVPAPVQPIMFRQFTMPQGVGSSVFPSMVSTGTEGVEGEGV